VTDKLSTEGYLGVAAVLYHRLGSHLPFSYRGEDAEARTKAMGSLRDTEVAKGLNAIFAHLQGQAHVRADRVENVAFWGI
jgi:dienelactone hydrolase